MAPGPKKKGGNKRTSDNSVDGKKNAKSHIPERASNSGKISGTDQREKSPSKDLNKLDNEEGVDKKYNKRAISNNWKKYDEISLDSHADLKRGEDFEVLISYSGGAGSQLQLQKEKGWNEAILDEKSIALDMKDIAHVLNCVPFHKLINLPDDVLSKDLVKDYTSSAETWKQSYEPNIETPLETEATSQEVVDALDADLNVIYNCGTEKIEKIMPSNSVKLDEKTENIIDSLVSCLSLKTSLSEKKAVKTEPQKETQGLFDDLDFLLSLNVSLKNLNNEEKQNESTKVNVDDWLSSILDE